MYAVALGFALAIAFACARVTFRGFLPVSDRSTGRANSYLVPGR